MRERRVRDGVPLHPRDGPVYRSGRVAAVKLDVLLKWIGGLVVTLLLAIFGFILKLTADGARALAQIEVLSQQMRDVAEHIGELVRAVP